MRLTKKFLTVLAPITIVGVITPTVVSCGNKDYKINYGDDINCKDKKDKKTYQKVGAVREAITKKIQVETIRTSIDLAALNEKVVTKESHEWQNVYYEVVYHFAFMVDEKVGFKLYNWNYDSEWFFIAEADGVHSIKHEKIIFNYEKGEDGKIHLVAKNFQSKEIDEDLDFVSHTYEHCTPQE